MGPLVVETMSWAQAVVIVGTLAGAGPLVMLAMAWLDRKVR